MGNYRRDAYHSRHPQWRNGFLRTGKYIGIEFECISNSSSYASLLEALPDVRNAARRPITESDGSLCHSRGLEIVFPPVSYRAIKNANSVFSKAVTSLEGKINLQSSWSTGMHMNVNTSWWGAPKKRLFTALFHYIPEQWLVKIGGRSLNGYCRQARYGSLHDYSGLGGHCYAAEARTNRVELRFPKSTTNKQKIHDLVDLIDQAETFATLYGETLSDPRKITHLFTEFLRNTKKGRYVYEALTGAAHSVKPKKKRTRKNTDSTAEPAQCVSVGTAASITGITSVTSREAGGSTTVSVSNQLGEFQSHSGSAFFAGAQLFGSGS